MKSALSPSRRLITMALAAVALLFAMHGRGWADYPEKPIRLLLPFPAGGDRRSCRRLVTARMAADLGKPIVVESKPGAGGIIATDAIAKAAADGYTLLITTPNHTINAALHPKLPYDTEKDLAPVSILAEVPEVLVSHPSAPFGTFKGFVDYAKAIPASSTTASAGNGTLPHVTMELLLKQYRHPGRAHSLSRRRTGDDRSARRRGAAQDGHLLRRQPAWWRPASCARWPTPHASARR